MDERKRELSALRNYGDKLLEEMRYPSLISMLQETISHITNIAEEYSEEAEKWHNKYDELSERNRILDKQISDLTDKGEKHNTRLCGSINAQAEKIERMNNDFAIKMDGLRGYRDQEIREYSSKLDMLIETQQTLNKLKTDVENIKKQLEKARQECEKEKSKYESERNKYQNQIEVNKTKLGEYEKLYKYKLDAEKKISKVEKDADDKVAAADKTAADWERKYGEEYTKREQLENELNSLKERLNGTTENIKQEGCNSANDTCKSNSYDDDETR